MHESKDNKQRVGVERLQPEQTRKRNTSSEEQHIIKIHKTLENGRIAGLHSTRTGTTCKPTPFIEPDTPLA